MTIEQRYRLIRLSDRRKVAWKRWPFAPEPEVWDRPIWSPADMYAIAGELPTANAVIVGLTDANLL